MKLEWEKKRVVAATGKDGDALRFRCHLAVEIAFDLLECFIKVLPRLGRQGAPQNALFFGQELPILFSPLSAIEVTTDDRRPGLLQAR